MMILVAKFRRAQDTEFPSDTSLNLAVVIDRLVAPVVWFLNDAQDTPRVRWFYVQPIRFIIFLIFTFQVLFFMFYVGTGKH